MACGNLLTDEELKQWMRDNGWLPKNPKYKTFFDQHHVYPRKFEPFFRIKSINIHNFSYRADRTAHRQAAYEYNRRWDEFIEKYGETADKWEIAQFAVQLEDEFLISKTDIPFIEPYHSPKDGK